MAASGAQAEAALRRAVADNAGKFVLVVEGAIPSKDNGIYMELGGRPGVEVLKEVAAQVGSGDRHRFLRLLGRGALGRSESNGRSWC